MCGACKRKNHEEELTVHNERKKSNDAMASHLPTGKNYIVMDTKLIQQYGEDILSYRLRTARQKKRMQYEDLDKFLIALNKEHVALYRHRYFPVWEPLIPAVQRGWKRFFVLRDDVARSKQANFVEGILKKINTEYWFHRKDFKIRKRKFGRKYYVVLSQELLEPDEQEFAKLNFTDAEKQFFHEEFPYDNRKGKFVKRYVFNEPWRFVLRVRPNMIDKQRKTDPEKESRLQEICNYLDNNDYGKRTQRILNGHYKHVYKKWKYIEKDKEKYIFKNKSLSSILETVREEVL